MTVNPPSHLHTCLLCKGEIPCWKVTCVVFSEIVCDECVENQIERADKSAVSDVN